MPSHEKPAAAATTATTANSAPPAASPGARLREILARGRLVAAPGIFDHVSLKIADAMGFDVLYMTGYGTVASHLGLPDAGLASYSDMVDRVASFCAMARTPIVCDADTGYGGLLNVAHAVRGYEQAGAAGIQLEDQEFPKKCGHTPGRRVIAADEMVRKIEVAVEARRNDIQIVARTDARTSLGLDEALRRMERYAKAGADVLFVESPESEDEMARIAASFDKPVLINVVEGGRTPVLPAARLEQLGFRLAIYPAAGFLAAAQALHVQYSHILETRSSLGADAPLYDFTAFSKLMGFEAIWAFDRRHAEV